MVKYLIINGPSGVGKGTIISELKSRYPDMFQFSVSHTSRKPRDGEIDKEHYHYVNEQTFLKMIESHELIEHTHIYGNYYGTSYKALQDIDEGKICILDLDEQGIKNCKKLELEGLYIYIAPPSIDELENRLRGRNSEREEDVKLRMLNATNMDIMLYDKVIHNGDLDDTIEKIMFLL